MNDLLSSVPLGLRRLDAFIVFGESLFLIAWHLLLISRAASQASVSKTLQRRIPWLVGLFFATWFAVALIVADSAHFPLAQEAARRPVSALVAFIPLAIALGFLVFSKTWRSVTASIPPASLIAIQVYRVAGGMFLFPFLTYQVLPAGFAYPAGIGDMLTGLFAPIVASAVAQNRHGAFRWAVAWNLFGILDLIVAPATAVFFQARVLQLYPLALVPLFLGPPMGILTHIYSLRNLIANRQARPVAVTSPHFQQAGA